MSTQAEGTLRLHEDQLRQINANAGEIYVNAEMAEEDKKINYELEMDRQFNLSISDISQVLIMRRYYANQVGEKLTVNQKLLHCNFQKSGNYKVQ